MKPTAFSISRSLEIPGNCFWMRVGCFDFVVKHLMRMAGKRQRELSRKRQQPIKKGLVVRLVQACWQR